MRKLIILAAAVLVASCQQPLRSAQAAELPKLIALNAGESWCITLIRKNGREGERYMHQLNGGCEFRGVQSDFSLDKHGLYTEDSECLPLKVGKRRPVGASSFGWTITFKCSFGESSPTIETYDLELFRGRELTIWKREY